MAVPKRRQNQARSRKRRSSKKLKEIPLSLCPQCSSPKMPHRLCSNCGYYGEKQLVDKEESK